MLAGRTTLTQYLIEERRRHPGASGELNALILDVALACKAISRVVGHGALASMRAAYRRRASRAASSSSASASSCRGSTASMVSGTTA